MKEFIENPMFATLGQLSDVELDRLHIICGFSPQKSRITKMNALTQATSHFEAIGNYCKQLGVNLHPNIKSGKQIPTPDSEMVWQYAKHQNTIPLILYINSFKTNKGELQFYLNKCFGHTPQSIPDVNEIHKIIKNRTYEIPKQDRDEQVQRIRACAERYGLREGSIFYEALWFEPNGQSQGGWGLELCERTKALYGFSMISGDTVEQIIEAIPFALQSSKKRIPRSR